MKTFTHSGSIWTGIILTFLGCTKEPKFDLSCFGSYLMEINFVPYVDQDVGCNFVLALYNYRGKDYVKLNNHCLDMISLPRDCDGNLLCSIQDYSDCENFDLEAEYLGIIGIDE